MHHNPKSASWRKVAGKSGKVEIRSIIISFRGFLPIVLFKNISCKPSVDSPSSYRHGSVVERRSPELHTDLVRVRASARTENISVWMMH